MSPDDDTHLDTLPATDGIRQLVVCIVSVDQILHNAPTLEDSNLLAVGKSVGQCWDAAIWIDLEEPRLLLSVLGYLNLGGVVRQTGQLASVSHGTILLGNPFFTDPSSSKVIEIFTPFGVCDVYR